MTGLKEPVRDILDLFKIIIYSYISYKECLLLSIN